MGKAKRILIAARKACHEPVNDKPPPDIPDDPAILREEENAYLIETVLLIRERLFEYVNDGCYPMGEFLDFENLENYVQWILIHGAF
jgi:hypothetical protein